MTDRQLIVGLDGFAYLLENDWTAPAWQTIAAQYSKIFGRHITILNPDDPDCSGYNGFRVKETETHWIEIHAMIVNWRLARVPKGRAYPVPDRFWCYERRDMISLALALKAAVRWDGADGTTPEGWTRDGQTGELREGW